MRVDEFDLHLPEKLIAQHPLEKRDASRLMVLDRSTGAILHRTFHEIIELLSEQDFLVFNDTKVIPARLNCYRRPDKTGDSELLLIRPLADGRWEALARPGRKLRPGVSVYLGDDCQRIKIEDITDFGGRIISFPDLSTEDVDQLIHRHGKMPLPPYIKEPLADGTRYQTVYAREEGSAAAPTAGLHFTSDLMKDLERKGVKIGFVTLHVGLGTFRPVKVETVEEHKMHAEFYRVGDELASAINAHRAKGGRVIAVGTTSIRTLESAADPGGQLSPGQGWTDIFITPGYRFRVVDGLITNFHLPRSTLLMLVSAMAGKDHIIHAYKEAVEEEYRFFSFGDAMFIK